MKITRTSPRFKQSNINHVCTQARAALRTGERHWSWDAAAEANSLVKGLHGSSVSRREDDTKWVYGYTPKVQPCDHAPVLQRVRVANLHETDEKRFRVSVKETDGTEKQIRVKLITQSVFLGPFGTAKTMVEFRKCNRGRNVRDMRTNTLVSPAYAQSEIARLCGDAKQAAEVIAQLFA